MLIETYSSLLSSYTSDTGHINSLWDEIEKHYSSSKRHYHNLIHLENLLSHLIEIKSKIKHWDGVLFALYYHDIIYNSLKSNNEQKSAELASKRLKEINVPIYIIEACYEHIIATKSHLTATNIDTNYFTDADLSILGYDWETYENYYNNIRKEYSIYPDLIYKPGRKKVLQHFISMEKIFKTEYFFNKFEATAKFNLQRELELIS